MKEKEEVKQQLEVSNHALANGILCAINDVTDVKKTVGELNVMVASINASTSKIHKVITGDPEFHNIGLIESQRLHHEEALKRHNQIMEKIADLENKRITVLEKAVIRIQTWGAAAMLGWGILVELLKYSFSKH